MKKVIRLTESDIENIVKKAVNEISYRKADNVVYDNGHIFDEMKKMFKPFLRNIEYHYEGTNNRYIGEIMKHAYAINDILERKLNQADRISDVLDNCKFDKWAEKNHDYADDDEFWSAQVGDILGDEYYNK